MDDGRALPFEQWYFDIPPVTRAYVTAIVVATLACQVDLVSPFHLYFNADLIWAGGEYWRFLTTFLYYGPLSIDLAFHVFFLLRYARALEEESFRGRLADFIWMLFLSATAIVALAHFTALHLLFLSSPLTHLIVYIWSRRNPHARMNFLGLFAFSAPYLPFVLTAFSVVISGHWPIGDLIGMVVGHVYYWGEDVWPPVSHSRSIAAARQLGLPPPTSQPPGLFHAPWFVKDFVDRMAGNMAPDPFARLDPGAEPVYVPEHRDVGGAVGYGAPVGGLGGAADGGVALGNPVPLGQAPQAAGRPGGAALDGVRRALRSVGLAHLLGGEAPQIAGWGQDNIAGWGNGGGGVGGGGGDGMDAARDTGGVHGVAGGAGRPYWTDRPDGDGVRRRANAGGESGSEDER